MDSLAVRHRIIKIMQLLMLACMLVVVTPAARVLAQDESQPVQAPVDFLNMPGPLTFRGQSYALAGSQRRDDRIEQIYRINNPYLQSQREHLTVSVGLFNGGAVEFAKVMVELSNARNRAAALPTMAKSDALNDGTGAIAYFGSLVTDKNGQAVFEFARYWLFDLAPGVVGGVAVTRTAAQTTPEALLQFGQEMEASAREDFYGLVDLPVQSIRFAIDRVPSN